MPRPKKQREPSVPITLSDYDGRWHGYLTVGRKENGGADIRHRSGKTYDECAAKILKLEGDLVAKGKAPDVGKSMVLADYLRQWHADGTRQRKQTDGSVRARWKYSTGRDYKLVIEDYIVPHAGGWRLDEFTSTTRHAKNMLGAIAEKVSESAARKAHLVLRSALSDAEEDDLVDRNIMKAISPPEVREAELEWLTVEEGKRILDAIAKRPRLRSRWLMAVMLGQRQGECLGLKWSRPELRGAPADVNLDTGEITIRKKLYRRTWQHGCEDPVVCVKTRVDGKGRPHNICKTNPCGVKYLHGCATAGESAVCGREHPRYCPQRKEDGCWRHRDKHDGKKECPAPCKEDCGEHASTCPQRVDGGLVEEDPKTKAGKRTVDMPPVLWDAFRERKQEQDRERIRAAGIWVETGYVHTTELGTPLDPRRDWDEWHEILAEAGVDPIKLHAARHYAVTILILLGLPTHVIIYILGWSTDMTKRYGHILKEMLAEAAQKIGDFYSAPAAEPRPPLFRQTKQGRGSSTDHATGNVIQGPWKVA